MNINTNYVNAHLVYSLEYAGLRIEHNSFDIVTARLPGGEGVAIHLIERDIDVGYIREILAYNGARDMGTLLLLWCPMLLPENGELYPPYDWMSALLDLYGDRIYAYENEGPTAWLFPVCFDAVPGTTKRLIRYGEVVDMTRLRCERIHVEGHIPGTWRIADFTPTADRGTGAGHSERLFRAGRNPLHVYFDLLGVSADADFETVRRAYRKLARQYHPDLNPTPESLRRMQEINAAYALIVARLLEDRRA